MVEAINPIEQNDYILQLDKETGDLTLSSSLSDEQIKSIVQKLKTAIDPNENDFDPEYASLRILFMEPERYDISTRTENGVTCGKVRAYALEQLNTLFGNESNPEPFGNNTSVYPNNDDDSYSSESSTRLAGLVVVVNSLPQNITDLTPQMAGVGGGLPIGNISDSVGGIMSEIAPSVMSGLTTALASSASVTSVAATVLALTDSLQNGETFLEDTADCVTDNIGLLSHTAVASGALGFLVGATNCISSDNVNNTLINCATFAALGASIGALAVAGEKHLGDEEFESYE